MPQIEVSFDIDANGILNVSAKDKTTGKVNSIKITASSGLSKDEVEKMKQEAAAHEADDKKKQEEVEIRNVAEQMIYTSEKALKENKEKIPADVTASIETKIAALKTAKDAQPSDVAAIKSASEVLSSEVSKIGEILAKANAAAGAQAGTGAGQAGAQGANGAGGSTGGADGKGPEGDVKDAEFKEKK